MISGSINYAKHLVAYGAVDGHVILSEDWVSDYYRGRLVVYYGDHDITNSMIDCSLLISSNNSAKTKL